MPGSGNARRLPCRSSSVTASFSKATTAPQNFPSKSSTTSPGSASTWGTGRWPGRGRRLPGGEHVAGYRLLRTAPSSPAAPCLVTEG